MLSGGSTPKEIQNSRCVPLLVDSGASVHAVGIELKNQLNGYRELDPNEECLELGDGSTHAVIGIGDLDKLIKDVRYCPQLQTNVISTRELSGLDLTTIIKSQSAGGGIDVVDSNNRTIFSTDNSYVAFYDKHNKQLNPSDSRITDSNIIATVISKTLDNKLKGKDKVDFIQRTFPFLGKGKLIQMAESHGIDNFPVTAEQLRKHWTQTPAYLAGAMRKSSLSTFQDDRGTEPGEIVWHDKVGPIHPKAPGNIDGFHIFIDHATCYLYVIFGTPNQSAEWIASCLRMVDNEYKRHGHSIRVFRQDSLPTVTGGRSIGGGAFKAAVDDMPIKLQFKAPDHHEGLDETFARIIGDGIRSAFHDCPWMPFTLWPWTVRLIVTALNLIIIDDGSNMTRSEAFTNITPDWKMTPLAPFGSPFVVLLSEAQQRKEFRLGSRGRVMAYLGPDTRSKNTQWFYDFQEKLPLRRADYRALNMIPDTWKTMKDTIPLTVTYPTELNEIMQWFKPWGGGVMRAEPDAEDQRLHPEDHQLHDIELPIPIDINPGAEGPIPNPILNPIVDIPMPDDGSDKSNTNNADAEADDADSTGARKMGQQNVAGAEPGLDGHLKSALQSLTAAMVEPENPMGTYAHRQGYPSKDTAADNTTTPNTNLPPPINPRIRKLPSAFDDFILSPPKKLATIRRVHWLDDIVPNIPTDKATATSDIPSPPQEHLPNPPPLWARRAAMLMVRRRMRKGKSKNSYTDSPTLKQALASPDAADWVLAIEAELKQMDQLGVWEVVLQQLPPGTPILPSHFILKKKYNADGSVDRRKARVVCGGNMQHASTYDQISSPTAVAPSVKLLFSIASKRAHVVRIFDVKAAYLRADLPESDVIYMRLPTKQGDPEVIVRLIKSLYGLKQAGALWYALITDTLETFGCTVNPADSCIWSYTDPATGETLDLGLHVDDMLCCATDTSLIDKLMDYIRVQIGEVEEVTKSKSHLGIHLNHLDDHSMHTSQPGYIEKMAKELNINLNTTGFDTPYQTEAQRSQDTTAVDPTKYRKGVGLLGHAANYTRPDVAMITNSLAKRTATATVADYEELLHVVKYLYCTRTLGITYSPSGAIELVAYVDASYNATAEAKGITGMTLHLGSSDGSIWARSYQQKLVSRASAESELQAIDSSTVDIEWVRWWLNHMGYQQKAPTIVYEDNQSTIQLAHTGGGFQRSKHLNMRYFYVRQAVEEHSIRLQYIPTGDQTADILTKVISSPTLFYKLRSQLLNCANNKSGI